MLGLRLGADPRVVITTTPRPTKLISELVADPSVVVTRGTTYDNRANLAQSFFDAIVIFVDRARCVNKTVPIEPSGKSRRESVGQLFVVPTVKDFIFRVTVVDSRVPAPVVASATKSEGYQAGDDVRSPEIILRDFVWWNPFRLVGPEIIVL